MNVEKTYNNDGTYNLYVNGRLEVEKESFTVCNSVQQALAGQGIGPWAEADETASRIKTAHKDHACPTCGNYCTNGLVICSQCHTSRIRT